MRPIRSLPVALFLAMRAHAVGAPTVPPALVPSALVIGEGTYGYLPDVSGCVESANAVAAALGVGGFQVVKRVNLSSGAMQAAIDDFARLRPNEPKFVYFCGYVGGYDGRDFLLPTSAAVSSPPDLLAQGVLVKSLITPAAGGGGFVLLDAVPLPRAPPAQAFRSSVPNVGVAMVIETGPTDAPTPLAAALAERLRHPPSTVAATLADIVQVVSPAGGARLLTIAAPPDIAWFSAPAPAPAPAPVPAITANAAPAATATPTALPAPAQGRMTEVDRRLMQIKLAELGYYGGRIDGVIGPETKAAIRRYQHGLNQEATGVLTGAEATRLLRGMQ